MRELEIRKKYKISPLTLNNIRRSFTGSSSTSRGRVIYDLTDDDKHLLSVAKLDPYTFREKYKTFAPFHSYMVFMLLTRDLNEVIEEVTLRKLVHKERIKSVVTAYRKNIITCLPPKVARWYKTNQDFPEEIEYWLKLIFKLLNISALYEHPGLLSFIDKILLDAPTRQTMEIFMSCNCRDLQELRSCMRPYMSEDIPQELVSLYKTVIYDVEPMTIDHWILYLKSLTKEDKEYKDLAFGNTIQEFLVDNHLHKGIQTDDFIKDMFDKVKRAWFSVDHMTAEDRRKTANDTIRNFVIIKELLPEVADKKQLKDKVEDNMRVKQSKLLNIGLERDKDDMEII